MDKHKILVERHLIDEPDDYYEKHGLYFPKSMSNFWKKDSDLKPIDKFIKKIRHKTFFSKIKKPD